MISFVYIILIFLLGLFISSQTAKRLKGNFIYLVFLVHMLFSYLYYLYAKTTSADSNMYYAKALTIDNPWEYFGTSTDFIIFLSSFFVQFGFSKLALFFLFGLSGFVGFIYLIKMLEHVPKLHFFGFPAVYLILLLPGFHFWTSALGKDSLMFLFLMLFFYQLTQRKKNWLVMAFAFLIIFLIRPHMGFLILLAISIALFLQSPAKYTIKNFLALGFSFVLIAVSVPFLASFLNVDKLEADMVMERVEFFNEYGAEQTDDLSSYVDVRSYNLPMKMFAYLFRPLFFDAHSMLQLLASFENLFLFIIIYKWLVSIKFKIRKWYKYLHLPDKILFVYFILGWIVLAASMYNLGLASRQKYMLLPIIFVLIFKNFNNRNSRLKKQH